MFADSLGQKLHHTTSENAHPRKPTKEGLYFPFRLRIGALANAFTEGAAARRPGDLARALLERVLTCSGRWVSVKGPTAQR